MRAKVGDRVLAVRDSSETQANVYGAGVYAGDEVPDSAPGEMGAMLREAGVSNPKIVLDNGKVVWGCECWWGAEDLLRKRLAGKNVVEVDIEADRSRAAEAGAGRAP